MQSQIIIDNIEEQKINGKPNLLYSQELNQNQKNETISKSPAKKLISYSPQKSRFFVSNTNIQKNFDLKSTKKSLDKLINKKYLKEYKNNISKKNLDIFDIGANIKKEKGYLSSFKKISGKTIKSIFFKSKNNLKGKLTSKKSFILDNLMNNKLDSENSFGINTSSLLDSESKLGLKNIMNKLSNKKIV